VWVRCLISIALAVECMRVFSNRIGLNCVHSIIIIKIKALRGQCTCLQKQLIIQRKTTNQSMKNKQNKMLSLMNKMSRIKIIISRITAHTQIYATQLHISYRTNRSNLLGESVVQLQHTNCRVQTWNLQTAHFYKQLGLMTCILRVHISSELKVARVCLHKLQQYFVLVSTDF
jgi:hypothetical protein